MSSSILVKSCSYILKHCFQARGFIAHQTPRAVYAAIYDDELRGKAYVRFKYEVNGGH